MAAVQPAVLLIADIGGYTRFMNLNRTSLAHAQAVIARLLEAVLDAAQSPFQLSKLEGDAAFFYAMGAASPQALADQIAAMHGAFHHRLANEMKALFCPCGGCKHAPDLKLKFVAHVGEVAVQKVKHMTELAGVDVIVVHRLLKNSVPVPEYILITEPLYRAAAPLWQSARNLEHELDDIGKIQTFFVGLDELAAPVPTKARSSRWRGILEQFRIILRGLPFLLGLRRPVFQLQPHNQQHTT
jgi:class 3 adenylate cyclase